MRTKMSARRALATAAIVAVFPIGIFLGSINGYSEHICEQLAKNLEVSLERQKEVQSQCNITVKTSHWNAFYLVLLASIAINWPVIRWLDDRQWYREWIRKENNE